MVPRTKRGGPWVVVSGGVLPSKVIDVLLSGKLILAPLLWTWLALASSLYQTLDADREYLY